MQGKQLTFDQIYKKFIDQGRTDICICEDGFNGWSKISKFFDLIQNDYFWSIPRVVFRLKTVHPKRRIQNRINTNKNKYNFGSKTAISFIEASQRFNNQGREDIQLCEDTYKGWTHKCKVYDKIVNDYYFITPEKLYYRKSVHPNRRIQKTKESNLENYGVDNPTKSEKIKEKVRKTNLEKFGFENAACSNLVKQKINKTCLEKYGVSYPLQSKEIFKKTKDTLNKKYNVNYPSKIKSIKIIDIDEYFTDWYEKQPKPKPSKIVITRILKGRKQTTLEEIKNIFENYKNSKTSLEMKFESLFNVKKFDKRIKHTNMLYRPDFKLSETVYVNVDGLYWHSEINSNKNKHFIMRKEFELNNLRLFQFHDDEIKNKSNIVKTIVCKKLNTIKNIIDCNDCEIKIINQKDAHKFLNENHLSGSIKAKHVGLYHLDKLVSIISYIEKNNICNIVRFCSLNDYNVLGAFSKLINYIENNLLKSFTFKICATVNLRYSSGSNLIKNGFRLKNEKLKWKWTNLKTTLNKKQNSCVKIYDAGQRYFEKILTSN